MYETAKLAWSKMKFDPKALPSLKKIVGDATNPTDDPPIEEVWGEKAISASSRTSHEAKSIAIEMNLDLLKKRDDHDEILYFLTNELHGRQARLHQPGLLDEQTRLLNRFLDILDDFDYLSSSDDPDVPEGECFQSKRALLITERNDLIKQIQYEITKPTAASHMARPPTSSPKSPRVQAQYTPVKQKEHTLVNQGKHTPVEEEKHELGSRSDMHMTAIQKLELDAIREFRAVTGVDFEETKKTLAYFNYNVDDALDYHFEDQDALKHTDTEMDVDPDELEKAIQLSLAPETPGDGCSLPDDDSTSNDKPSRIPNAEEQYTEDASRRGRSHAGQPILLDPQGNFKAHVHSMPPPRSLWEKYQTMRSRLHVQYYGSSTWFDNPDPLRGVPTRERAGYVKPAEQTQDNDDAAGYRDVGQENAAREYREGEGSHHVERTADVADAAGPNNDSTRGNYSPAHSDYDSVIGDDEAASELDLDYLMDNAEENNRQNARQENFQPDCLILADPERLNNGLEKADLERNISLSNSMGKDGERAAEEGDVEPNSFVHLRDLEKVKGLVDDDAATGQKEGLFASNQGHVWGGYDSDADEMDIDGKEMVGSDADAQGATDDEQHTFGSSMEEEDEEREADEEKYDSPMVFKPEGDVDMDAEEDDSS